ncbi:uncharacterized protein LOC101855261 [Aplysia californica]|uniref:Uncharacterized protein LOC101855261 n=1 Tax=Aplysia californica TaxID=6500 RepID=A0ABM0JRP6_APLCA|nr:uncharacterized protein LOC101855261 [Aplysia californica]
MVLTNQKAYDILGLPAGADLNSVLLKYKKLACKWHPENESEKHSSESLKKFKQVTMAYKRLTTKDFKQDLSLTDCLSMFRDVVSFRNVTNGSKYASSDSSDENNSEEECSSDSDDNSPVNNKARDKDYSSSQANSVSIPNSDITEEERERRRAEKRRAKKKRQRERKRLEKEQKSNSSNKKDGRSTYGDDKSILHEDSNSGDDTVFDPTSAFFTKVVSKKKKNGHVPDHSHNHKGHEKDDEVEDIVDPRVLRSRQLAVRGNEMAQVDQYTAAIQLFTEAISLDPVDFRFFGNRSYCYDRTKQYDKALRDAEKAIHLDKDWPKGYFRKGRALAGLKMFSDAEKAFMQVLKLDKNCDDAVTELLEVRTHLLMDMGFSKSRSEAAIKKHDSVQAALDSLLTGCVDSSVSDLYISDDENEGFSVHRPAPIPPPTSHPTDVKMDPTNPEGLTALWVGNVLPSVTEKRLNQLFSKFGQVTSVRPLPDKYCAFINFKTKEAAGRAMHQLQGTEIDGQKLLIKFPDNPLSSNSGNITIRKPVSSGPVKQGNVRNAPKQTGPVNGDECYFWRTTGCTFGSDCKWQHFPKSKGIDRKPWQK